MVPKRVEHVSKTRLVSGHNFTARKNASPVQSAKALYQGTTSVVPKAVENIGLQPLRNSGQILLRHL